MAAFGGFEAFLHSHRNPVFANLGGCGDICKALLPRCKEFRESVGNRAAGSTDSPARGLWRGSSPNPGRGARGPSSSDSVNSAFSCSTTASVNNRMNAVKKAMKAHDLCRRYLRKAGQAVPENLHAAIELCLAKGFIKPELAKEFHEWRKAANEARHVWVG